MLRVITFDDDRLKRKSEEVKNIDADVKKLVKEMYNIMHFANGIGLAAVQLGILKRIFVIDIPEVGKFEMINPIIIDKSIESAYYKEGCLSLPGISNEVERSDEVTVEYQDLSSKKKKKFTATGLLATCIQHEYDHLEGILFIDRLNPEIRLKKIQEYKKLHIV